MKSVKKTLLIVIPVASIFSDGFRYIKSRVNIKINGTDKRDKTQEKKIILGPNATKGCITIPTQDAATIVNKTKNSNKRARLTCMKIGDDIFFINSPLI
jgi:hypothetical protein